MQKIPDSEQTQGVATTNSFSFLADMEEPIINCEEGTEGTEQRITNRDPTRCNGREVKEVPHHKFRD